MNRDQIITEVYNNKELRRAIRSYCRDAGKREDLLHTVIEVLCKMPEETIINIYNQGKINYYVFIAMVREVSLPRSPFNKQNNPTYDFIDDMNLNLEDISDDEDAPFMNVDLIDQFKAFCDENKTNPELSLQSLVTLEYMEYEPIKKRSFRDFQKKTGIHYSSACVYVRTMVKEFNKTKQ